MMPGETSNHMCDPDIRDHLPAFAAGGVSESLALQIEDHLSSCPECLEELKVIRSLLKAGQAPVPSDLEARIQARIRSDLTTTVPGSATEKDERTGVIPFRLRPSSLPAWALSAAAVLVLALGTAVVLDGRSGDATLDPILVASQEPLPEEWLWDDGMVAGAPVFDDLSDEDLVALLAEFEG